MYDIRSAVQAMDPRQISDLPEGPLRQITSLYGHYRLDYFDQAALEDMRQRLSRKGVSFHQFCGDYLPYSARG